jgi:hypothetical protein
LIGFGALPVADLAEIEGEQRKPVKAKRWRKGDRLKDQFVSYQIVDTGYGAIEEEEVDSNEVWPTKRSYALPKDATWDVYSVSIESDPNHFV